jgi:hypothetical protein
LQADLDDDEPLLVAVRVAVARRSRAAQHFPLPGRIFVVGLSARRLLLWRASPWLGRPGVLATSVPLDQVTGLVLVHRLVSSRLRVTLATGSMLLLEPTWGGSLRAMSETYAAVRPHV